MDVWCIGVWVYGWVYGCCMDAWVHGCMDVCVHVWGSKVPRHDNPNSRANPFWILRYCPGTPSRFSSAARLLICLAWVCPRAPSENMYK